MGKRDVASAVLVRSCSDGGVSRPHTYLVPPHEDRADYWIDQLRVVGGGLDVDDTSLGVSILKLVRHRGRFADEHGHGAFGSDPWVLGVRTIRRPNVGASARNGGGYVGAVGLWAHTGLFTPAPRLNTPVVATQRVDKLSTHGVEHGGVVARSYVPDTPVGVRDAVGVSLVISLVGPGDGLREGSHSASGVPEPIDRKMGRPCQNATNVVK